MIPPPRASHATFDKALSVSSPDQGNLDMPKIICVLYDDPVDGYPKSYPRDDLPKIEHYPGGQTLPTPKAIDFKPGALLGSVSGELGLRKYLESNGHTFVVTADRDGPGSVFERELPDADVVISQPFWPAYLTAERIAKAKKLKHVSPPGAVTRILGSQIPTQAAVAARHVRKASSRKTRSVRRDVRWRWTLKVLWTAA
jgi:hypothetical protein